MPKFLSNIQIKNLGRSIFTLGLVLVILMGTLSPVKNISAQAPTPTPPAPQPTPTPPPAPAPSPTPTPAPANTDAGKTLADNMVCLSLTKGSLEGCLLKFMYYIFFGLATFFMTLAASFLNIIIPLSISTALYTNDFIAPAWAIVRDLSNVFFILVLLYIAIQTILDLGHGSKQMVAKVIVMAMLINFSMFFTKIVIDSSNILALVFYNNINVETTADTSSYIPLLNPTKLGILDKDISGGIVAAFRPNRFINEDLFNKAGEKVVGVNNLGNFGLLLASPLGGPAMMGYMSGKFVNTWLLSLVGVYVPSTGVPPTLLFAVIFTGGLIMFFAAYALFMASLGFLSRLIDLWFLIIFSPFAFMSASIPELSHIENIGWESWMKKLIKSAFSAPIFMFFLYLIFKLNKIDIFSNLGSRTFDNQHGPIEPLLFIILPALVTLILLNQATKFAKEQAGKLGEVVLSTIKNMAKIAGAAGLIAAGLATGGAALTGAVLGRKFIASKLAGETKRADVKEHATKSFAYQQWEHGGRVGVAPVVPAEPADRWGKLASKVTQAQLRSGEINHARSDWDKLKESNHLKGVADSQLSDIDMGVLEASYKKDNRTEIEASIRRGYDAKGKPVTWNGAPVETKGAFEKRERERLEADERAAGHTKRLADGTADPNGELTQEAMGRIKSELEIALNAHLQDFGDKIGKQKFETMTAEATQQVGLKTKVLARATSGGYDIRDLPSITLDKREGLGAKATVGIIAAVATGMRMGLKQGAGINYGTPQRDILQDISNTITESFKNAKINLDFKSASGGGGGSHAKDTHSTSGGGHH